MKFNNMVPRIGRFLSTNSPTILTTLGTVGVVTTAYLSGKASIRAYQLIDDENRLRDYEDGDLDRKQILQLIWKEFVPPVLVGSLTVWAILGVNRVGSHRVAVASAALAMSERAREEYQGKVVDVLGATKDRKVRDELASDHVRRNPPTSEVLLDDGDVLCKDGFSGRYFSSTMEKIRRAENNVNRQIINDDFATVSNYYSSLGLPPTEFSDDMGWNTDKCLVLTTSSTLTKDDVPCLYVSFGTAPFPEPWRFC